MTTSSPSYQGADGGSQGSGKVREDVHKTVDDARKGAAGRVEGIAESIDAAATHLDQEDMTRLSGYVHDVAAKLTEFSRDLQTKSGDEMLQEIKHIAQRNPALFLGGSVALGFGMSRFARAGRTRERQLPVRMDETRTGYQAASGTKSNAQSATAYAPSPPPSTPSASPSARDYGDLP